VADLDILVVCLGNVCRSPVAERLLRLRFRELLGSRADALSVSSAGVTALVGRPMDAASAAELRRLGGDPEGFVARQCRPEMADGAGLVLTATREVRSRVLQEAPRALRRTFTLREFAALTRLPSVSDADPWASPADLVRGAASWRSSALLEDQDVEDPIGRPAQVHGRVADLLDRECSTIARAVVAALVGDARVR
jgi:protein-tyrosine phosphatase